MQPCICEKANWLTEQSHKFSGQKLPHSTQLELRITLQVKKFVNDVLVKPPTTRVMHSKTTLSRQTENLGTSSLFANWTITLSTQHNLKLLCSWNWQCGTQTHQTQLNWTSGVSSQLDQQFLWKKEQLQDNGNWANHPNSQNDKAQLPKQYHPISLLSCFAKFFEKNDCKKTLLSSRNTRYPFTRTIRTKKSLKDNLFAWLKPYIIHWGKTKILHWLL